MFRQDRVNNKGGGVLLYVKKELDPVDFTPRSAFLEQISCKLNDKNNNELLIGVCYRSTNLSIYEDGSHGVLLDLLDEMKDRRILSLWATSTIEVLIGYHEIALIMHKKKLLTFLCAWLNM